MAFVMAKQRGWTKPLQFTVCNDFATMRAKVSTLVCCCVQRETVHRRLLKIRFASLCNSCAQVNSGECQALMWERFITKPCVLCVHTIDLWPRYPSQVGCGPLRAGSWTQASSGWSTLFRRHGPASQARPDRPTFPSPSHFLTLT